MRESFTLGHGANLLAGWREGSGPPVLVLHGGPGLSHDYLEPMAADIGPRYEVASYQQRGLAPSTTTPGPGLGQEIADVVRVLDALGWERAWLVGHSWGGHLALHVAASNGERLFGVLAVDPLGAVGDGGMAEFGAEMEGRADDETLRRVAAIDEGAAETGLTDAAFRERLGLMWPSYFAEPHLAPPMPDMAASADVYASLMPGVMEALPALEAALPAIAVPVGILAGARSPMPVDQAAATSARIPGAWLEVAEGAGHFVWYESPGSVGAAVERLTSA